MDTIEETSHGKRRKRTEHPALSGRNYSETDRQLMEDADMRDLMPGK